MISIFAVSRCCVRLAYSILFIRNFSFEGIRLVPIAAVDHTCAFFLT